MPPKNHFLKKPVVINSMIFSNGLGPLKDLQIFIKLKRQRKKDK